MENRVFEQKSTGPGRKFFSWRVCVPVGHLERCSELIQSSPSLREPHYIHMKMQFPTTLGDKARGAFLRARAVCTSQGASQWQ